MIADDAEAVAELGGDVEHGLARPHDRDVDQRAAAVDPEVERAERHRGVVALALGLQVAGVIIGRDQLDLGRPEAAERRRRDRDDSNLHLGR